MHELGICDALLKMVDSVAKDEELECVKKVTVEVGTLSGVIPAYLSDCWTAVTDGTAYPDTPSRPSRPSSSRNDTPG